MSDEINDIIITIIQGFPNLYNKKDPSYKDLIKRKKSWKTIAEFTGMTVNDCQKRWKSLRDRYCREKKKADAPSGSGAIYITESSQQLIRSMSFLDTIVHHRTTSGNYGTQPFSRKNIGHSESETLPIDGTSASPQPSTSGINTRSSCSRRIISSSSMKKIQMASHDESTNSSQSLVRIAPPLSSPVANPSPSPTHISKASTPVGRYRTVSSSDREESSSSISYSDFSLEEEILANQIDDADPVPRTSSTEPKEPRTMRSRNDEVNAAIINARGSLSPAKRLKKHEPPEADQLFAKSLVAELQRFPARKRTFIKGELMQLLSRYDETELE